jgi:hypothetical protein
MISLAGVAVELPQHFSRRQLVPICFQSGAENLIALRIARMIHHRNSLESQYLSNNLKKEVYGKNISVTGATTSKLFKARRNSSPPSHANIIPAAQNQWHY